MYKKIILLASVLAISILAAIPVAYADSPALYVSPSSHSGTVGSPFTVSVRVDPAGSKVCVVKGTLNFSNLSCSSISVASGVMAQTAPTCSNPTFSIGIPGCATTYQKLFSVSVKGIHAGQGILSFSGGKVAGVGVWITSTSQGGTYNITAAPITPKNPENPETTTPGTTISGTTTSGVTTPENDNENPETINPATTTDSGTTNPGAATVSEGAGSQSGNPADSGGNPETNNEPASLLSVLTSILSLGTGNGWLAIIVLIILILLAIYLIWGRKRDKEK